MWHPTLEAMFKTIHAVIEQNDIKTLDLLHIHAAALANVFYSRSPDTYVYVMGLSVQCLIALGDLDEAEQRLRSMEWILAQSKSTNEPHH